MQNDIFSDRQPTLTAFWDSRHRISIYGQTLQVDCGNCPNTAEISPEDFQIDQGSFQCPVCGNLDELVLDRFEPRRPYGWV